MRRVRGRPAARDLPLDDACEAGQEPGALVWIDLYEPSPAWVAILAVPTMIAGIYGMNFEHRPELRWTFGSPMALTVIVVVCSSLYVKFKRSGWL